jgi:uncharacterized membrane protein
MNAVLDAIGKLHPVFVHWPVALISTAAVAEAIYMAKKAEWFAGAARFMISAGAWMAVLAAMAGFAAASGETFAGETARNFSIHWVGGVAVAVLAFLAWAMGEGSRRTGQVWEQALYRVLLFLAAIVVLVTGWFGGEIDLPSVDEGSTAVDFSLTMIASFWY